MKDTSKRDPESRGYAHMQVTRKLIIMVSLALLIIGLIFSISLWFNGKLMISWICIMSGIIGGFVSIQQRLKNIGDQDLKLLASSWYQLLLIPIYGGVFSLLLYVIFLSEILSGVFFPEFDIPVLDGVMSMEYMEDFISNTYPATGQDFAKLIFWCFVAGFSERFVPQIISKMTKRPVEEGQR